MLPSSMCIVRVLWEAACSSYCTGIFVSFFKQMLAETAWGSSGLMWRQLHNTSQHCDAPLPMHRCAREVSERYPDIAYDEMIVDNTCMQLVGGLHVIQF
jgi:hypothetical protein